MTLERLTASGLGVALWLSASSASSEPAPRPRSEPASTPACRVQGLAELRANAPIEDAQGRLLARFSGAPVLLVVDTFPAQAGGRVRVTTGTGKGSFRVQGFTPVQELALYATAPVAVAPGHLWIAAGKPLAFVGSGLGSIQVEKRVSLPFAQNFRAWAPCASLSLAPPTALPFIAHRHETNGFVTRRTRLELIADPKKPETRVTTLLPAPNAPPALFHGLERRGDFVRVEYRGDVVIDAWARASDLEALPEGELSDQLTQETRRSNASRLAVQGEPRVIKALREVPFRARALESEAPIGVIEPEAEAYVLDVVAGWVSVMPKALEVVPRPDGQFWVRREELGM